VKILDPLQIIHEFFNKVEEYTVTKPNRSATNLLYKLEFIDLLNGRILNNCQVTSLNVGQDVGATRTGYEWSMELICYEGASQFTSETVWDSIIGVVTGAIDTAAVFLRSLEGVIDGARDYAIAPIKKALGAVRRTSRAYRDLVASGVYTVGEVRRTIDDVRSAITDVIHSVAVSITSITDLWSNSLVPLASTNYWKAIWRDWADASQLTTDDNDGTPRSEDLTLGEVMQELEQAAYQLEVAAGYLGYTRRTDESLPTGSGGSFLDKEEAYRLMAQYAGGAVASSEPESEGNQVPFVLRMGDNLYTVAAQIFGDASRWSRLAEINGWLDATTMANGQLAQAGSSILVPIEDEGVPIQYLNHLNDRSSVLLTDLQLTAEGELTLSRSRADLDLIHGEDNFVQALLNRLHTVQGELPYQTNYGLNAPIGSPNNERASNLLTLDIIDQLLADERVAQVKDVAITQDGDTAHVELNIVPISGESVNIILPL
jgi:hypothetical protein